MEVVADSVQDGVSNMVNGIDENVEAADSIAELTGDISSRPIRKAKRNLGKVGNHELGPEGAAAQVKKALPLSKNSRKSRDGRGRGLPKKGKHVVVFLFINLVHVCSWSKLPCFKPQHQPLVYLYQHNSPRMFTLHLKQVQFRLISFMSFN